MNNQIIINSVNELGYIKTYYAIKELVTVHQLISFKQANRLIADLTELEANKV